MMKSHSLFNIFIFLSVVAVSSAAGFKHCFDVLEKFTPPQIDRIHSLTIDQVSKTTPAKDIFSCYLKETRLNGSKSVIEQYFDIYKKCNELRANRIEYVSETQIEELENMGLPLYLQNYVIEHIQLTNGVQVIDYIQKELAKKIELSEAFFIYRNTLLRYQVQHRYKTSGQSTLYCTLTVPFNILLITMTANLLR
ncbi:hypothetical protein DOY81_012815 [Sarcophaga bullata]|nr:hypothetical protein DOY81_012815 [Sarcophaga bullata]